MAAAGECLYLFFFFGLCLCFLYLDDFIVGRAVRSHTVVVLCLLL